jgi:hypothetical protein
MKIFSILSCLILLISHSQYIPASEGLKEEEKNPKQERRERKTKGDRMDERRKPGERGPHKRDHTLRDLLEKLNLSEEQRKTAKTLMSEMIEEQKQIHHKIKPLIEKMEKLKSSDNYDEDELIKIGGELGTLKTKISLCMPNFFKKLKLHLSEEQQDSLKKIREELKERKRDFKRRRDQMQGKFHRSRGGNSEQMEKFKKKRHQKENEEE